MRRIVSLRLLGSATVLLILAATAGCGGGGGGGDDARDFDSTGFPFGAHVADFNGDGLLDDASGFAPSLNLRTALRNVDGAFGIYDGDTGQPVRVQSESRGMPVTLPSGILPRLFGSSAQSLDINGDAFPDFLGYDGQYVSVTCGVDGIRFDTIIEHLIDPVNGFVPRASMGDADTDGLLDFIVAQNPADDITVQFLTPAGVPGPAGTLVLTLDGEMQGVAITDVNDDGVPDLLAAVEGRAQLSLYRGLGNRTFAAEEAFALPAGLLQSGDTPRLVGQFEANNDDLPDVMIQTFDNALIQLLNSGGGVFTGEVVVPPVANALLEWAVGDVDGDDFLDLVYLPLPTPSLGPAAAPVCLLSDGSGGYQSVTSSVLIGNNGSMELRDFTGDGQTDLRLGTVVLEGLGNGQFTDSAVAVGFVLSELHVGDFNGDGRDDILAQGLETPAVIVMNNQPGATPIEGLSLLAQLAVTDMNGDGFDDVVSATANEAAETLTMETRFGSAGGDLSDPVSTIISDEDIDSPVNLAGVVAGDFDGDDIPDLAVGAREGRVVKVFAGTETGAFGMVPIGEVSTIGMAEKLAVADFSGDLNLDLVVFSDASTSYVEFFEGIGDGNFMAGESLGADPRSNAALAAIDFDLDGNVDVVVDYSPETVNPGTIKVFINDGSADFTEQTVELSPDEDSTNYRSTFADLDGDARIDMIRSVAPDNYVLVRFGLNDGSFGLTHYFSTGDGPRRAVVGDFDGDDLPDLAVPNATGESITLIAF